MLLGWINGDNIVENYLDSDSWRDDVSIFIDLQHSESLRRSPVHQKNNLI